MSVMASQTTVNSPVYSKLVLTNTKVRHEWSFVRGIHQSPVDSHQKGPVIQKTLRLCVIMIRVIIIEDSSSREIHLFWSAGLMSDYIMQGTDVAISVRGLAFHAALINCLCKTIWHWPKMWTVTSSSVTDHEVLVPNGRHLSAMVLTHCAPVRHIRWIRTSLVRIMAWNMFDANPLPKPMLFWHHWVIFKSGPIYSHGLTVD